MDENFEVRVAIPDDQHCHRAGVADEDQKGLAQEYIFAFIADKDADRI